MIRVKSILGAEYLFMIFTVYISYLLACMLVYSSFKTLKCWNYRFYGTQWLPNYSWFQKNLRKSVWDLKRAGDLQVNLYSILYCNFTFMNNYANSLIGNGISYSTTKRMYLAKLLAVFSKFSNVLVYSISHHNNSTCIINSVAS